MMLLLVIVIVYLTALFAKQISDTILHCHHCDHELSLKCSKVLIRPWKCFPSITTSSTLSSVSFCMYVDLSDGQMLAKWTSLQRNSDGNGQGHDEPIPHMQRCIPLSISTITRRLDKMTGDRSPRPATCWGHTSRFSWRQSSYGLVNFQADWYYHYT